MPRRDTTGPDGKGPKKINKGVPSRDGRGRGGGTGKRGGSGGGQGRGGGRVGTSKSTET